MATDTLVVHTFSSPRRYTRFKLDVPVRAIVHLPSKTVVVHGRATELNEGGLSLFAGVELKIGDEMEVEFTPPYRGPIRVPSIVRDREGYSYGVEFLPLSNEDFERIGSIRDVLRAMGCPIH